MGIFQPVVGPDVIIPKPSLRDTATASCDTQTDHNLLNLLVVNTVITLLRRTFLSKVMRCVQQSRKNKDSIIWLEAPRSLKHMGEIMEKWEIK